MKHSLPLALALSLALTACSNAIDEYGYSVDPLEPMNRVVFTFNDALDTTLLKPLSHVYDFVTPRVVQNRVNHFFGNLDDVGSFANSLVQLEFKQSLQILARVINNTVFGLGGLFDVATPMGNPKIQTDFGATLEHYGIKSGPYLVLPFFGPSTVRDAAGRVVDSTTDPVAYLDPERDRWIVRGVDTLQTRTNLLKVEKALDPESDRYALIRDSWLQYRWAQLYGEAGKSGQQSAMDDIFADEFADGLPAPSNEAAPTDAANEMDAIFAEEQGNAPTPTHAMDDIFAEEQQPAPASGSDLPGFRWVWPAGK